MPLACVVGDTTTGHGESVTVDGRFPIQNLSVSIENLKVIVVGERLSSHSAVLLGRHSVRTSTGSANVFINSKPVVRAFDSCNCGVTMTAGFQTTVFVNGRF